MITVSFIDQLDQPSIRDREVKARWIKMQQSLSLLGKFLTIWFIKYSGIFQNRVKGI